MDRAELSKCCAWLVIPTFPTEDSPSRTSLNWAVRFCCDADAVVVFCELSAAIMGVLVLSEGSNRSPVLSRCR
jgi:hypothetical protein